MRRPTRRILWILGIVVGVPLVLAGLAVGILNLDAGQRLAERLTAQLTGGTVIVTGLSGHVPGDLHIDRLELRDSVGVWLTATDIAVSSSTAALLLRRIDVSHLSAAHVLIARAAVAAPAGTGPGGAGGFDWRVDVGDLAVPRLKLGAPLAGTDTLLDLKGRVHLGGTETIDTAVVARRLDGPGTYELAGRLDPTRIEAVLEVHEPAGGPLQNLAGVPGIGAVSVHLKVEGPRTREAVDLEVAAGALKASAHGAVDWAASRADLDVVATSPAMTLGPTLAWDGIDLKGRYHGAFRAPDLALSLTARNVHAAAVSFSGLTIEATGNLGTATATATVAGLGIPGPDPGLFAKEPIALKVDARFVDPAWHLDYVATHALAQAHGLAVLDPQQPRATVAATLPAVEPFARLAGLGLAGRAEIDGTVGRTGDEWRAQLKALLTRGGGPGLVAHLLAGSATLEAAGSWRGQRVEIERARLESRAVRASLQGVSVGGALDFAWAADLPTLAEVSAALAGTASGRGRIRGTVRDFGGSANLKVDASAHSSARGLLALEVEASGFPDRPAMSIEAHGDLDGAPLRIAAALKRTSDGGAHADIERATWKTASATGSVLVPPGQRPMRGRLALDLPELADFGRLLGEPIHGRVKGEVDFVSGEHDSRAEFSVEATDAGVPTRSVAHLSAAGRIDSPTRSPTVTFTAQATGVVAGTLKGDAELKATGPEHALALALAAHGVDADGEALTGTFAGTLDVPDERLALTSLEASARGQTARLLAPATLTFRNGLVVDGLVLGSERAVLAASGHLGATLGLTAALRNATPAALSAFYPDWQFEGRLDADVTVAGTPAAPEGRLSVHGTNLRIRSDSGRAVPATELAGTLTLHEGIATTDVLLHAGTAADLHVAGTVPVHRDQSYALTATGKLALATANPFLEPNGRRIRGEATIEATVSGSATDPTISGSISVAHGDIQDFVHGAHLTDVELAIAAKDRTLELTRFVAHAGPGTIEVTGTIGALEPLMPLDLKVTARNAQPLASDLLTARFDGSLAIAGTAERALKATGRVHVNRADINIPNALPRDVAVLDVRRPHAKPPPPRSWTLAPITLDIAIDAPREVFLHGRGLDAELGGSLQVSGTYDAPEFAGGFDMRRGTLALAGASLKFTSGRVSLNGAGSKNALDPTLDLVADSTSGDVTATLTVGGYASAPTIELTSTPELPQDEILSRLLFGTDARQLAPLQMLSIGVALASISGVGYGAADPLAAIQKRLGLDRLAIGGTSTPEGNVATVEAGRYVSSRVYVGAVQSSTGITKVQAQVDLTRHLKLQTVVGNGSATAQGTTPQNDPGNTVGLVYQIDY